MLEEVLIIERPSMIVSMLQTRMKKGIESFRHQKGKRTAGEFSVVLLRRDEGDDDDSTFERDTRVWVGFIFSTRASSITITTITETSRLSAISVGFVMV